MWECGKTKSFSTFPHLKSPQDQELRVDEDILKNSHSSIVEASNGQV